MSARRSASLGLVRTMGVVLRSPVPPAFRSADTRQQTFFKLYEGRRHLLIAMLCKTAEQRRHGRELKLGRGRQRVGAGQDIVITIAVIAGIDGEVAADHHAALPRHDGQGPIVEVRAVEPRGPRAVRRLRRGGGGHRRAHEGPDLPSLARPDRGGGLHDRVGAVGG